MEHFEITPTNGEWHIEGFPDAAKVFRLEGQKAKRLADLSLHHGDLHFVLECLNGINLLADKPNMLRQGLWYSAIVHFMKCFGGRSSRVSLDPNSVYKGDKDWKEPFQYFKSLRNKHIVHDENSYTQSLPGAILNKREGDHKIAKIICLPTIGNTLDQNAYTGLHQLTTVALEWVDEKFEDLCNLLTLELEAVPYDELLSREAIVYSPPKIEEINRPRNTP